MIHFRPAIPEDAEALFPLVNQNEVTNTLLWDGPESVQEYRDSLAVRYEKTRRGESHVFTIVRNEDALPIGGCSVRPEENAAFRGDIGIWIGAPYHNKGYGTRVIQGCLIYGFAKLGMRKIEATVFTDNYASRKAFEKNGFQLEGTIRYAVQKRGRLVDEWLLGITLPDWEAKRSAKASEHGCREREQVVVHVCRQEEWQQSLENGVYRHNSLEQEGFIHCSRPDQIPGVIDRYFKNTSGLIRLWIDPYDISPELRWEESEQDIFPHIYGPLNLNAVLFVDEIPT